MSERTLKSSTESENNRRSVNQGTMKYYTADEIRAKLEEVLNEKV